MTHAKPPRTQWSAEQRSAVNPRPCILPDLTFAGFAASREALSLSLIPNSKVDGSSP